MAIIETTRKREYNQPQMRKLLGLDDKEKIIAFIVKDGIITVETREGLNVARDEIQLGYSKGKTRNLG